MDIEGTYTLQAPPAVVWHSLGNRQMLLRALPGVEELEQSDGQSFVFTLHLKHSLLRGTYRGKAVLTDQQEPHHCRILLESDGQSNPFSGNGAIHLHQRDNATIITYQGNIQLGRTDTHLAQAVTRGATKLVIQRMLTGLAGQLQAEIAHAAPAEEEESILPESKKLYLPGGAIVVLPPPPVSESPQRPQLLQKLAQTIVHWFHLGAGNPELEALWIRRVQRMSVVAALLLLVWVGTRLPRRS